MLCYISSLLLVPRYYEIEPLDTPSSIRVSLLDCTFLRRRVLVLNIINEPYLRVNFILGECLITSLCGRIKTMLPYSQCDMWQIGYIVPAIEMGLLDILILFELLKWVYFRQLNGIWKFMEPSLPSFGTTPSPTFSFSHEWMVLCSDSEAEKQRDCLHQDHRTCNITSREPIPNTNQGINDKNTKPKTQLAKALRWSRNQAFSQHARVPPFEERPKYKDEEELGEREKHRRNISQRTDMEGKNHYYQSQVDH